jgi:hypothetical protein
MVRGTIESNALLSALSTNYRLRLQYGHTFGNIRPTAQIYDNCSCASSSACTEQSYIYNHPNMTTLLNVPGFYTGCYVIESLLQSTLECLYNQTCINELRTHFRSSSLTVEALNSSLPSQYLENSTIKELLDQLMIEKWIPLQMYDRYYNECQPAQCTYTVDTRNDAIYIVTATIGIVGGLVQILKIIVPRLVKLVMYCIRKRRERRTRRVVPQVSIVQT